MVAIERGPRAPTMLMGSFGSPPERQAPHYIPHRYGVFSCATYNNRLPNYFMAEENVGLEPMGLPLLTSQSDPDGAMPASQRIIRSSCLRLYNLRQLTRTLLPER